ncbi:MAG TPA: PEP-CTERM sorting domain-containing protein [Bryobacteraceae bacterium]|nr:PEP-CTERM sorting domain-containing protein [Bryobacteraceae bacterium]
MSRLHTILLAALLGTIPALCAPVTWVDWTSGTAGTNGSAAGVLHLGSTDVDVTYTGEIQFLQTNGAGTYYWTQPDPSLLPYTSSLVDNAPPDADIIALSQATTKTLTFSQPVDNLFFAVVSLNGNGYEFSQDFDIVSAGCGYWGCGSFVKATGSGTYDLDADTSGTGLGPEPHGVIRFEGAVSSITWTSLTAENWNGFTIGTYGLADDPTPEPESWGLAALGLALVLFGRFRRKRSAEC